MYIEAQEICLGSDTYVIRLGYFLICKKKTLSKQSETNKKMKLACKFSKSPVSQRSIIYEASFNDLPRLGGLGIFVRPGRIGDLGRVMGISVTAACSLGV
jgi:hypothetical protein